jgi:hypothetical protein
MDARRWTSAWLETIATNPAIPTDEGTMIGWFANSIMAGYDEAMRRSTRRADRLRSALAGIVGSTDKSTLLEMRAVVLTHGGSEAGTALEAINTLLADFHGE